MKKENLLQNTVYHLLRFSVQLNAAFADFIPITFARSGSWPNNVVIEPPPEAKKIEKRRDFQKTLYSLMYIYNDLHTVFVHCSYFGNMLVNSFLFLILSISFSIQNVRTCLQTKKVNLSLRFLKMFQIHIPDLLYRLKA